ncbi:MAG: hypothetical protein QXW10_00250 [Candidatus Micrarchaeaceae archaeon]
METETQGRAQELDDTLVFASIGALKRLSPLIRKAPVGERRVQMLQELAGYLERLKDSGKDSLEFIGSLNVGRVIKALGIEPEKLSNELSAIVYNTVGSAGYTADTTSYNVNNSAILSWPVFNHENEEAAKAFVEGLIRHINLIVGNSHT